MFLISEPYHSTPALFLLFKVIPTYSAFKSAPLVKVAILPLVPALSTDNFDVGEEVPTPKFPSIIAPFVGAAILLYPVPTLRLPSMSSLEVGLESPIPILLLFSVTTLSSIVFESAHLVNLPAVPVPSIFSSIKIC